MLFVITICSADPCKESFEKGASYKSQGEYQKALGEYEKAICSCQDKRNKSMAINNKGCILEDLGRYDEALQAYKQALSIDPDNEIPKINVSDLLSKMEGLNSTNSSSDTNLTESKERENNTENSPLDFDNNYNNTDSKITNLNDAGKKDGALQFIEEKFEQFLNGLKY
jgi:tetratricopeptide (TPR) repeat protein